MIVIFTVVVMRTRAVGVDGEFFLFFVIAIAMRMVAVTMRVPVRTVGMPVVMAVLRAVLVRVHFGILRLSFRLPGIRAGGEKKQGKSENGDVFFHERDVNA